ncbi:bifunctional 2-polyprenyl-6-hydroxyphenol methylase/3-demethylubiquinol 3-O-methyltransferase UbiG [Iodidimonas sp. SYSU 1G8]|uniref:bifunctional 2-polyprenyl-6-hydroxyphenol methylase/3-demethylubiquinol 3-O-methyltransferase UbiG n=1 Tax=Iodidimonas sp. SYSU 1G8 TaxID=3133967 RepID=UPI0031FEF733
MSDSITTSIDAEEVARFEAMADLWWDPTGPFKPLHRFNPVRLEFVRDTALAHWGRTGGSLRPLSGLSAVDIGCGGGLISEPLARMGASVTGIDPSEKNIGTARLHASQTGTQIDYRAMTAEDLAASGARFDIVLNLEVVEHVADVDGFLAASGMLLKPGGLMICATLNRTIKSLAMAKIGAEYILRWLPRGTHDWRKFLTPSELVGSLRRAGLSVTALQGVTYAPLRDSWSLSRDTDVNYMVVAVKPAG